MGFVHLNVHSNFSLLNGATPVEQLVRKAVELGISTMALTDTNGMYAVIPFLKICCQEGIRPVLGTELKNDNHRALLLARNREGYAEICRLITQFHLDKKNFIFSKVLGGVSENVFVITDDEHLLKGLASRPNVFVEMFNHAGKGSRQQLYHFDSLAKKLGLKTVATNKVHFSEKDEYRVHLILNAMRTNSTIGTLAPSEHSHVESWLKSPEEMERLFQQFPEAIENSEIIAWECEVDLEIGSMKPPSFPVPAGETSFSYLCKLAFQGLSKRYHPITKEAYDTLNKELDVIHKLDLPEYFLICWDITHFARQRGMYCLGRGSAANSIVSYCLNITHVDPLANNLFFERFLNLERSSMPDFDIDFGTDDRETVLDYVFNKYGKNKVAMICTYNTLRARSAVREVGKALGIPVGEIDGFVKRLPHFEEIAGLAERLKKNPETCNLPVHRQPFRTIMSLAERISGFPRHLSTHPCGIVISPSPITDFVPLQRGDKGLIITQWSMYPIEDAGLIKIDLLGQKGLAVIKETLEIVERSTNKRLEIDAINPETDVKTRKWLSKGLTVGCFYIESPVMISLIQQAGCNDFQVLTALSSIIRPGVSNYGGKKMYLKRHLGLEPVKYLHPMLEKILKDTYGCLIYQEQVIQVASTIAGMSLAEADGLRKCMSKKRNWEKMENYRARFFEGAKRNNIPVPVIESLFNQIQSFAGYAFCKAHSASFALESFLSMYLKCHYPAEFMAAVLSNRGGYYSQAEYMEEARRCGLKIFPPSIQESEWRFKGNERSIRVGLMQVKNLSQESGESIVENRKQYGPFPDLPDLLRRVKLSKPEVENLILCGALDCLGMNRPSLLWLLEILQSQHALTRGVTTSELLKNLPRVKDYSPLKKKRVELDILGFTVDCHPFNLYKQKLAKIKRLRPVIPSSQLCNHVNKTVYCLGWLITWKKTRIQRSGELMKFVSFSDETGRFEATFFPGVYKEYALELLKGNGPFLVKGRVENDLGYCSLTASHVKLV